MVSDLPIYWLEDRPILSHDLSPSLFLGFIIQLAFTFIPLFLAVHLDAGMMSKTSSRRVEPSTLRSLSLLSIVALFGVALRAYKFGEAFPPGVEQDEYIWLNDYLHAAAGIGSFFGLGSFGIPILQGSAPTYVVLVWGITPNTMRFWSLLTGTLTLIPFFFMCRWIFGTRTAVAAAALLSFSPYAIFYSRIISGGRILLNACSSILLTYAAFRSGGKRGNFLTLFAGLLLGFSLYDYFAVRVLPVFLVLLASGLLFDRVRAGSAKEFFGRTVIFGGAVLAALLPLLFSSAERRSELLVRMSEESLIGDFLHGNFPVIFRQVLHTASMFFFTVPDGRAAWFSNPALTHFSILSALFFAFGIGVLLVRRNAATVGMLGALVIAVLPTLLSTTPPDSHRAILSVLPAHVIAGLGIVALLSAAPWKGLLPLVLACCFIFEAPRLARFSSDDQFLYDQFHAVWQKRIAVLRSLLAPQHLVQVGITSRVESASLLSDFDFFEGEKLLFPGLRYEHFTWQSLISSSSDGARIFHIFSPSQFTQNYFEKFFPHSSNIQIAIRDDPELFVFVEGDSKCADKGCDKIIQPLVELRLLSGNTDYLPISLVPFPATRHLLDLAPESKREDIDRIINSNELTEIRWRVLREGSFELPHRFSLRRGSLTVIPPNGGPIHMDTSTSDNPLEVRLDKIGPRTVLSLKRLQPGTRLLPLTDDEPFR